MLVPDLTEIEWGIRPLLEQWADVASYDAPGVGDRPLAAAIDGDVLAHAGLDELHRRGWSEAIIVADGYANHVAVRLGSLLGDGTRGIALGHACLSLASTGARPARTPGVFDVLIQLARTDYGSFRRALTQITTGSFDDEMVERVTERVPQGVAERYLEWIEAEGEGIRWEDTLRELGVPLLLAEHHGCVQWTREGYEDAVAAFPGAATASCSRKPSVDEGFAEALRSFCSQIGG